ncbi:MAG TPA: hypothetical protein DCL73_05860 [Treponema sp.]|nr:hypothetical protein [Treponema sp.]
MKNKKTKNNKDGISVIIPTFNRASFLYPTLVCLSNQKIDANINYEVIVVDSGNDESKLIVKHFIEQKPKIFTYKKIKYCSNRALLRNTGVSLTNYNLILFLDNDMLVPPEYLQVHYNVHKENKNLLVCGRRRTLVNFKLNEIGEDILMHNFSLLEKLPWYDDERLEQNIGFESWRYVYTHSMSVSKDLFLKVGGFTNKFGNVWGGEDIEASYKMFQKGAEFKFLTEPVIYHQGHFSQSTSEQHSAISSSRLFVRTLNSTYFIFDSSDKIYFFFCRIIVHFFDLAAERRTTFLYLPYIYCISISSTPLLYKRAFPAMTTRSFCPFSQYKIPLRSDSC